MTEFQQIITAAIEEQGGAVVYDANSQWTKWYFHWRGSKIFLYFGPSGESPYCQFYWRSTFMFRMHPEDLLDPSWSSTTLIEKIDEGIARTRLAARAVKIEAKLRRRARAGVRMEVWKGVKND